MSSSPADEQPFLKYSDDDAASEEAGLPSQRDRKSSKRRWRILSPLLSHSLVFVLTSLLWIFLIPNPRLSAGASSSSSSTAHQHTSPSTKMPTSSSSSTGSGSTVATTGHQHDHDDHKVHNPASIHNVTTGATFLDCGKSTPEAQAKGCQYDILLNHWVPSVCTDGEWIENYVEDDTWYGFRDEARTQRLATVREMSEVDHYFTSTRDHVNHCVVLWRKQFVALFEEKNLDSIIASWGHTEHCSQFLLDVTDKFPALYEEPIKVEVGWSGCWVKDKQ